MLRQAAFRLSGSLGGLVRSIGTTAARLEGEAAPAGVKEFTEAWAKTAPSTLALPELPTNFLAPETSGEAAVDGERFAVNLFTPHGMVAQSKVRRICARSLFCCCCGVLRAPSVVRSQPPIGLVRTLQFLWERGAVSVLCRASRLPRSPVLPQDIPRPLSVWVAQTPCLWAAGVCTPHMHWARHRLDGSHTHPARQGLLCPVVHLQLPLWCMSIA